MTMIRLLTFLALTTSSFSSFAQEAAAPAPAPVPTPAVAAQPTENTTMVFSCQRFKSKCTGFSCNALASGLQKDTEHTILTATKTELVEYTIDPKHAVELLKTEQVDPLLKRELSIKYDFVDNAYGKLTLSNKDKKNIVKEKVDIDPTSGFYLYYLIHTDGSIKDVPIGEPFAAYFGWCENKSAPGAMIPDTTPPAPLTPPATASGTNTAPVVSPAVTSPTATAPVTPPAATEKK